MSRLLFSAAVCTLLAVLVVPELQRWSANPPSSGSDAPAAAPARASGGARLGDVVVDADAAGHFAVTASTGGRRLDFLVDTGATLVALREAEARRIGLFVAPADFTLPVSTANGTVNGARVRLDDLTVGSIRIGGVEALVLPDAALGRNLLGMSFLGRLARFEVSDRRMVMAD